MPYICEDCNYIFKGKITSCPACGLRTYNDERSVAALREAGYKYAPGQGSASDAQSSEDRFERLRRTYEEQHSGGTGRAAGVGTDSTANGGTGSTAAPRSRAASSSTSGSTNGSPQPHATAPTPENLNRRTQGNNFFGQQNRESHAPQTQVVDIDRSNGANNVNITQTGGAGSGETERQRLERERRNNNRRQFWDNADDALSSIRWGTVLRILLLVFAVVVVVFLFKNRQIILNSILGLVTRIIGILIIFLIIRGLLRSIFRR